MNFRERVLSGEPLAGTHISMGEVYTADIFARTGYDYVWIDTEHSVIDYKELLACITVLRAHGTAVIVRTHTGDHFHTKRILEMGSDGIVFPNVETAEQARDAVRSCLYPPEGFRGFGPLGVVTYGLVPIEVYIPRSRDVCILVQIESKTAVENMDALCENSRIDGYILGPCDLSGSIGELGEIHGAATLDLARRTVETARRHGKRAGISLGATEAAEQKFWYDMGFTMMSAGADYAFMQEAAQHNFAQMREMMGKA